MGISLGIVGIGAFGSGFVELFKRHPLVDRLALCDREPERVAQFAGREDFKDKLAQKDLYASLDETCAAGLDALVIMTQPWLHAPQCVKAMETGHHVYSAVPIISLPDDDEILGWCDRLVETCRRTGMRYMLGETTYYRPQTMFCRRMAEEGRFGEFVYAEGEYFHDLDSACSLRKVQAHREASASGREWAELKKAYVARGVKGGPMHYPTHSTCGPVSVMKAHALKATACGYANRNADGFFADAAFSNEVALYTMSNGASVRICEFRECCGAWHEEETFRVMGTSGCFAENTWKENRRTAPGTAQPVETTSLTPEEMRDPLPDEVARAWRGASGDSVDYGGHGGSHAYLVHEFVSSVAEDRQPAVNVWEAVRYMAMGVAAHKSALAGGETVDVPDWGDAPR